MSTPDPSEDKTYVIDIKQAAETARLITQDRLLTEAIGGLLPEQPDLSLVTDIVDLACGPGCWAVDVARAYPTINVIGVDINRMMTTYARAQTQVRQLKNVTFETMDVTKTLGFQDESFDIVNARSIVAFMSQDSWPRLLKECWRILRPGGLLRLTEAEVSVTNSLAAQRLNVAMTRAFQKQGRTFSVDGNSYGIAYMLCKLLADAQFQDIGKRPFVFDSSSNSDLHDSGVKDGEIFFSLLKPYLIQAGVIGDEEFEELYEQMLDDVAQEGFTSMTFGLTAWGRKPDEE